MRVRDSLGRPDQTGASRKTYMHKDKSTETVTERLGSERSPMTILPVVDGDKHPP